MTTDLLKVPDDVLCNIATYLSAKDLLQFLCTHKRLSDLSKNESFWQLLLLVSFSNNNNNNNNRTTIKRDGSTPPRGGETSSARKAYLTKAYVNALPVVEWIPCRSSRTSPTFREGHLACKIGHSIVITGGFTDDEAVYVLDTRRRRRRNSSSSNDDDDADENEWIQITTPNYEPAWNHPQNAPRPVLPTHSNNNVVGHQPYQHVYGATLTPLDDRRAIRFGGFTGGGYSGECDQLALLTIQQQEQELEEDGTPPQPQPPKATWQVLHAYNKENVPYGLARAYHTATLVANRYLVVLGGMIPTGCIRREAVLDTQTWTWLTGTPIVEEEMVLHSKLPTGRHGHSVVLDETRNRFVLFGGGSGTNLLRSGSDNAEVWELVMGSNWKSANDAAEFQNSMPWNWRLVLDEVGKKEDDYDYDRNENSESESENESESDIDEDDRHYTGMVQSIDNLEDSDDVDDMEHNCKGSAGDSDSDGDSDDQSIPPLLPPRRESDSAADTTDDHHQISAESSGNPNRLTDAEKLCLGRCHLGFRVGSDTVLLVFGSGRPSTNACLAFDLVSNTFFRPKLGGDRLLPPARFTAAGVLFGEYDSYLLVHGGYSSQAGSAIEGISVLDLAPALERDFRVLPKNHDFDPHPPVTQDDVHRHRQFGPHFGGMENVLENLFLELATHAEMPGMPTRGERPPHPMVAQMMGEILRNAPQEWDDDDDQNDEDGDNGDDERDDDDDDFHGGNRAAFMLNMLANSLPAGRPDPVDDDEEPRSGTIGLMGPMVGIEMRFGYDEDEDEEVFNSADEGYLDYDTDDISEVS